MIPVFAFRLVGQASGYTVFDVSEALRLHGRQVPAYTLPANLQDTAVLRIVVRNGFGQDLAQLLARDLRTVTARLAAARPAAARAPHRLPPLTATKTEQP
jgi:glutamate decarboxylase